MHDDLVAKVRKLARSHPTARRVLQELVIAVEASTPASTPEDDERSSSTGGTRSGHDFGPFNDLRYCRTCGCNNSIGHRLTCR